jgi:hypothetical protein
VRFPAPIALAGLIARQSPGVMDRALYRHRPSVFIFVDEFPYQELICVAELMGIPALHPGKYDILQIRLRKKYGFISFPSPPGRLYKL